LSTLKMVLTIKYPSKIMRLEDPRDVKSDRARGNVSLRPAVDRER
jgi:hypothetical protein